MSGPKSPAQAAFSRLIRFAFMTSVRRMRSNSIGHVVGDLGALGGVERLKHTAAFASCTGNNENRVTF
jgi:hypothetical protein